jgi:hypothetical protein
LEKAEPLPTLPFEIYSALTSDLPQADFERFKKGMLALIQVTLCGVLMVAGTRRQDPWEQIWKAMKDTGVLT